MPPLLCKARQDAQASAFQLLWNHPPCQVAHQFLQNKGIAVKDDLMTRLSNAIKQRDVAREEALLAKEELKKMQASPRDGQACSMHMRSMRLVVCAWGSSGCGASPCSTRSKASAVPVPTLSSTADQRCVHRQGCMCHTPATACCGPSGLTMLFTCCLQEDLETGALQAAPKAGVGAPGSPEVAQQQPGPQLGRVSESGSPQQVVPPQQQQHLPPQPQAAPADPGELLLPPQPAAACFILS